MPGEGAGVNASQRAHHQAVAEMVVAGTGTYTERAIDKIENPRILARVLRLDAQLSGGRVREFVRKAIARRRAELKAVAVRTCRRCGCTDGQGCPGGCIWVAEDLCSECGEG